MEHTNEIAELVIRAKATDQEAWDELYRITVKGAYFTARKVLGNSEEAIDIVQDAYIVAFQRLEQLEEPSKFVSWFGMIVANKCRDYLKRKKPLLFSDIQEEDTPEIDWEDLALEGKPEQVLDQKETVRLVAQMIEELPEDQKICIILFYRDELSVAEIAQALEVSEGTVKSRLNYARKKIKTRVEELEKKGTKLYGVAPLSILGLLLRREAAETEVPAKLLAEGVSACGTVAGSSAVAVTATTTAEVVATTAIVGSVGTKIAASVVAVAMLGGGVAYTVQQIPTPEEKAVRAYEEFLAEEISPDGLEMNYYTYLDLDSDGVPELLVSDQEGTTQDWSEGEVFCYDGDAVLLCSRTDARYEPFYMVNGNEILGRNRMGNQFIGINGSIVTTSYKWDEGMTRNDPALRRNGGDWEYITQEEFDYYNPSLSQVADGSVESYIKTIEPITLSPNTWVQRPLAQMLDFSLPWSVEEKFEGDKHTYMTTYVFNQDGTCYCFLGMAFSEITTFYKGTFTEENGEISFDLVSNHGGTVKCTYQILKKAMGVDLIQTSEEGLRAKHSAGHRLSLRENKNDTVGRLLKIADSVWWSTPEAEVGTRYYSVDIPAEWAGKCLVNYDEDDRTVIVYEKENYYNKFGMGQLFSVTLYRKDADMSYLPNYKIVGECVVENEAHYVVVLIPTDVQFTQEYMDQYQALAEDVPEICGNIVVN